MHFCNNCENMLYIRLSDEESESNKLIYYCRNCGNIEDTFSKKNICVLENNYKHSESNIKQDINEYTKFDPTLPRINNIRCPNTSCKSNLPEASQDDKEVIYLRTDDINMNYVYICAKCDTIWKTSD